VRDHSEGLRHVHNGPVGKHVAACVWWKKGQVAEQAKYDRQERRYGMERVRKRGGKKRGRREGM
jgi:hypothetical protein